MPNITRRSFMEMAAGIGAAAAWGNPFGAESTTSWRERRDLFAEGVASGDPDSTSALLWTRYSAKERNAPAELRLEVAEDPSFNSVVAATTTHASPAADLTCRVLVGGLKPARIYWYRFSDRDGNGSRIGRTRTAPGLDDPRPVWFAFVSCQNVTQGAQNAYRRMIFEDERAPDGEQIGFVLHLGDFIYEITWYPEDRPQGMYDRKIREVYRYPDGEKIQDFHIPTTLEGYRTAYKGYLHDPDLQDARARWPFVSMWDNHEFSWLGWQSFQKFQGKTRAAQTRKVAANQAFFEYQPARMARPNSRSLEEFYPPQVLDIPITRFDDHGLGQEPNNLAAMGSLKGYRAIRWGRNVELIVTDQRTYRSEEPTDMLEAKGLVSEDFPELIPEEPIKILDAARAYNGGHPPPTIRSANGDVELPNIWRERPPQTILGAEQKAWFLERLKNSKATWKIWGNTTATLDMRADPQNLPAGTGQPWPWTGYASFAGSGDHSTAFVERAEIYDFVREHGITGFATVAGDRHSFWAGLAAKSLPPGPFVPVGIAFVTGSISAPGIVEAFEHGFPKVHPLRMLFLGQGPQDTRPQPTVNLLLRHGVRSCIEYQHTGDIVAARAVSNPDLSPHLSFVDVGGHGYSVVRATSETFETEFVCIPRPVERAAGDDGGPVIYRAKHSTRLWRRGRTPELKVQILEGDPKFSI